MIGYYVHHQGRGHLHRALAVAEHLTTPVTGLSTLPRPAGWPGGWIELPDDAVGSVTDADARGRLHWVPEHHAGLRDRMGEISSWIVDLEPDLMVVDVSVEVSLLARLHGVPVLVVAQPGDRTDAPHELGYGLACQVVGPWPADAEVLRSCRAEDVATVGAFSRFDLRDRVPASGSGAARRRAVFLAGAGGTEVTSRELEAAIAETPGWDWTVLGREGAWRDDPWEDLCRADVVVTHAGQNAVAEVAAARVPAVVVPQARPFGEQLATARALARSATLPVVVRPTFPDRGWADVLDAAAQLDGRRWLAWNDGGGARRAAAVVEAALNAGERRARLGAPA